MRRLDGKVPFRGGGFAPARHAGAAVATLLGLVALWQVGASAGLISTMFLPAPIAIAIALYHLTISGELWKQLSASLSRLAVGWVIGTVFGIGLGLAVGLWSALRSPGMAVVSALFPDSEDRAGAAVHHLVRDRRGLEDHHAGVRGVLPDRDRDGRRGGQCAARR